MPNWRDYSQVRTLKKSSGTGWSKKRTYWRPNCNANSRKKNYQCKKVLGRKLVNKKLKRSWIVHQNKPAAQAKIHRRNVLNPPGGKSMPNFKHYLHLRNMIALWRMRKRISDSCSDRADKAKNSWFPSASRRASKESSAYRTRYCKGWNRKKWRHSPWLCENNWNQRSDKVTPK